MLILWLGKHATGEKAFATEQSVYSTRWVFHSRNRNDRINRTIVRFIRTCALGRSCFPSQVRAAAALCRGPVIRIKISEERAFRTRARPRVGQAVAAMSALGLPGSRLSALSFGCSPPSTDQQQARRASAHRRGRAMHAGLHRAAGIVHRDPPKIAEPEPKRLRPRHRHVVQIVAVFVQILVEGRPLRPAEAPQQFRPRARHVHAALRLLVAQPFRRRFGVAAQPRVGRPRCAVRMPRIHVGRHDRVVLVPRIRRNAIQHRREPEPAEPLQVRDQDFHRRPPRRTPRLRPQSRVVERRDAVPASDPRDDFVEIARQRPRPAQRVDPVAKRRRRERFERMHDPDPAVIRRRTEGEGVGFQAQAEVPALMKPLPSVDNPRFAPPRLKTPNLERRQRFRFVVLRFTAEECSGLSF